MTVSAPTPQRPTPAVTARRNMRDSDSRAVQRILSTAGVFSAEEIEVGTQMANDTFLQGSDATELDFLFLDDEQGEVCAYACFGRTLLTARCWDLYWLVTDPACQGCGLAARLMTVMGNEIIDRNGQWLFAETSSLPHYQPARRFYERAGFALMATIPDFYKDGDSKLILRKDLKKQ